MATTISIGWVRVVVMRVFTRGVDVHAGDPTLVALVESLRVVGMVEDDGDSTDEVRDGWAAPLVSHWVFTIFLLRKNHQLEFFIVEGRLDLESTSSGKSQA